MPCKNPECTRNTVSDSELLDKTIEQLLNVVVPKEIADKAGSCCSCARCANIKIAEWLKELKNRRNENAE